MELPDPYEFETFDRFFRNRPGWEAVDSIDEPYVREFEYRGTFADRDRLVHTTDFNLWDLSAEPSKLAGQPQVVVFTLPHIDLPNGPHEEERCVHVDLAAPDAEDQVAAWEQQVREVAASHLVLALLYGTEDAIGESLN